MKTKHPIKRSFAIEFPAICNHCGVTNGGLKSQNVEILWEVFMVLLGKTTPCGKIFKILFRKFSLPHRFLIVISSDDRAILYCYRDITWYYVSLRSSTPIMLPGAVSFSCAVLDGYSVASTTAMWLVCSLVLSRLDYCNIRLPNSTIWILQHIQNTAAWLIIALWPHDHITQVLKDLHWLHVDFCMKCKVCLLMHMVHTGQCPSYLADTVVPTAFIRAACNGNGKW